MEQMDFSIEVSESETEKFADYLYQKENAKATINKSIQDCRMAAHNIVPVQIYSSADIFRNINAICPPFIAIRKSSIIRKLL